MIKIKFSAGLQRFFSSVGHLFRSTRKPGEDETRKFGVEKPKFIASLQKRKWLWRILISFTMIIALIFVTGITAYITMVLSVKGEDVTLPDLAGKTTTEALEILGELDLKLKINEQRESSQAVEDGKILRQVPDAGTSVKRNSPVQATLSSGSRTIIVPSLIGQSARNAATQFSAKGLNLNWISQVYSDFLATNNVIAQEPPPGAELVRGSRVDLLVSLGPREMLYVMPDLIGKEESEVRSVLTQMGFRIGNVYTRRYPGIKSNVIINQYPKAGYAVTKSDIINLWISD